MDRFVPLIVVTLLYVALEIGRVFSRAVMERDRAAWITVLLAYGMHLVLVWLSYAMVVSGYYHMAILTGIFVLLALGAGIGILGGVGLSLLRYPFQHNR